jgi:hypothetical protein
VILRETGREKARQTEEGVIVVVVVVVVEDICPRHARPCVLVEEAQSVLHLLMDISLGRSVIVVDVGSYSD